MSSRWEDVFRFLKSKNVNVFSPGIKVGECTEKYIVLKNAGASKHPNFSTQNSFYTIFCYVPKTKYSELETYVQSIKATMKELEPMILFTGNETPSYYDDTVKAHMISIEFKNYKKL